MFFSIAAILGWLFLDWGRDRTILSQGESQPQFGGPPGLPDKGKRLWGSPNRDLHPPLDAPRYLSAAEADAFLGRSDWVYLLPDGKLTSVFPEVLMATHHVVNDWIGGQPVAVTYCLLTGSSMSYSRRLDDRTLTFGTSGQLYCGNSVLFDRETGTDWLQLSGEPIRGRFHGRARLQGRTLERTVWGRVRQCGNLRVLAPVGGIEEYRDFQYQIEREKLGQKVVESRQVLDPRLPPYTRGLGICIQGEARFYPERANGEATLLQDRVGGWSVVIIRGGADFASRIFRRRQDGKVLDFTLDGTAIIDRQTGSRWDLGGACIEGPLRGARLEAPFYSTAYWFVWSALHPDTGIPS